VADQEEANNNASDKNYSTTCYPDLLGSDIGRFREHGRAVSRAIRKFGLAMRPA
jgi:hypothetical protein